ncbi:MULTISPECIES: single-stranded DNA-binding protein [unclassified Bradyrhizobium]|uniref:single-stranded DNA-binding protein n=1 Tax=unclassified Bradyrhizobium TaxID=2631580 RepID=UPI002916DA7A|nr:MULTISPECIES: single-stranded DNA-binding protein [unclassified Bradyrhizobium]
MSGSLNRAQLVGNVGQDPDIRRTQDGRPIANLSIATSEQWTDKATGERKEQTQWHRVVVFNEALCKVVAQYVKKGSKLLVEGKIETRKWTAQDGGERYTTEIVLRNFDARLLLLGDRRAGGPPNDDADRSAARSLPPRNSGSISSGRASDMDDDIPF